MRIASRDLRVVSVGLVSAVVLAACSGNSSKPTVLPALTTSATPVAVATAPAPAPTTPPAPVTSAAPPSAASTGAAVSLTTKAVETPTASHGDPAVATKLIDVVKAYYTIADAAPHNAALLAKWRSTFTSSCVQCLAEYNTIKKELGLGTRYVGGGYNIKSLRTTSWDDQFGHVNITFFAEAGKAYDRNGKLIDSVGTSKLRHARVAVQKIQGNWLVVFYEEPTA